MTSINPLITSAEEQFIVGESDFSYFEQNAHRLEGCAILFCREGHAEVMVDQCQGRLQCNSTVLLLPGSYLLFLDRTENFRASYCTFSRDLFLEAAFRLDPGFFEIVHRNPFSSTPPQRIVDGTNIWFQMMAFNYRDRQNIYRNTIVKNRLQNVLLEIYDKMQRFASKQMPAGESTTRQTELFRRFVALVHEYCSQEREVSFYADRLCISTRYLSTIVRSVSHTSAKEFIDRSVMLEIRMMLRSTDLSVQEIAYRLKFPDQSYLGRFFKKHAGESPTEYRNARRG